VTRLVLDSGGVSRLARRSQDAAALITVFVRQGTWPPVVPTVVLVECLSGRPPHDAVTNRFLKTCDVVDDVSEHLARRAGVLRAAARRGSAVDALVVAIAEPSGSVLTGDIGDLQALAAHAEDVSVILA
jgi:predicted nucleic acid-binding protein